jgi:hypothetical protein
VPPLSLTSAVRRDPRAGPAVPRRIAGFHPDGEGHWVADLECGHTQHVRHEPPWQVRPWVLTPEGRAGFLGRALECPACAAGDPAAPSPPAPGDPP